MNPNYAYEIKARVTMTDILNAYGFQLVMGRMPCPFHNGKDRNFSVMKNRAYRCWVCGESGDQITFVERYFGLDFQNAIRKINEDFHLGLPISDEARRKQSDEARKQAEREAEDRKRQIEGRKKQESELRSRYEDALDAFCSCDTIMTKCRPISPSSGISDVYAWAAKNIDRLWSELKEAEFAMFDFDRKVAENAL